MTDFSDKDIQYFEGPQCPVNVDTQWLAPALISWVGNSMVDMGRKHSLDMRSILKGNKPASQLFGVNLSVAALLKRGLDPKSFPDLARARNGFQTLHTIREKWMERTPQNRALALKMLYERLGETRDRETINWITQSITYYTADDPRENLLLTFLLSRPVELIGKCFSSRTLPNNDSELSQLDVGVALGLLAKLEPGAFRKKFAPRKSRGAPSVPLMRVLCGFCGRASHTAYKCPQYKGEKSSVTLSYYQEVVQDSPYYKKPEDLFEIVQGITSPPETEIPTPDSSTMGSPSVVSVCHTPTTRSTQIKELHVTTKREDTQPVPEPVKAKPTEIVQPVRQQQAENSSSEVDYTHIRSALAVAVVKKYVAKKVSLKGTDATNKTVNALLNIGFHTTANDKHIIVRENSIVILFKNTMLALSSSATVNADIILSLMKVLIVVELGEPTSLLDMDVAVHGEELDLSLKTYIEKTQNEFQAEVPTTELLRPMSKAVQYKIQYGDKVRLDEKQANVYNSLVDRLQFMVDTVRYDMALAVSVLAECRSTAGRTHLSAALNVLAYAVQTKDFALHYKTEQSVKVHPTPSDDWKDYLESGIPYPPANRWSLVVVPQVEELFNPRTHNARVGSMILLNSNVVSWKSSEVGKTNYWSMSTFTFIALSTGVRDASVLRCMLKGLEVSPAYIDTWTDNITSLDCAMKNWADLDRGMPGVLDEYKDVEDWIKERSVKFSRLGYFRNGADPCSILTKSLNDREFQDTLALVNLK